MVEAWGSIEDGRSELDPEEQLIVPYKARTPFHAYHKRDARWAVMVCHRRAGKTVAAVNELIYRAGSWERPRPRAAYIAPLFKQAKGALYH